MKVKWNNPENGRGLRVRASCCLLLLSPVVVLIPCVCVCVDVCIWVKSVRLQLRGPR